MMFAEGMVMANFTNLFASQRRLTTAEELHVHNYKVRMLV